MNRIKQSFRTSKLATLFCAILVTLLVTPSLATPNSQKMFCNSFAGEKSNRAFLFNATGTELLTHFDIGHLDVAKNKLDADYIISSQQFRLVLFPKRLEFDNYDTQSIGLWKKKIQARCPLTSEYILNVGVVAQNFKPGKLDTEVNIKIIDPKLRFPEYTNVKLAYRNVIKGALSMPRTDVDESSLSQNSLKSLFGVGKNSAKIMIRNTGDRPLRFSEWEKADHQQEQEITIQKNTCVNILLEPSGRCEITISKTSENALSKDFYYWASMPRVGNFMLPVILDIQKLGNSEVEVSVRNR